MALPTRSKWRFPDLGKTGVQKSKVKKLWNSSRRESRKPFSCGDEQREQGTQLPDATCSIWGATCTGRVSRLVQNHVKPQDHSDSGGKASSELLAVCLQRTGSS
ncbi:hypothetical protein BZZ01_01720 [Nostocales cyanobacterium HT-58-2]|nr:hypothetical protein BZZ01_01720 [Nostocales cyanobacterium HT-58-2]